MWLLPWHLQGLEFIEIIFADTDGTADLIQSSIRNVIDFVMD